MIYNETIFSKNTIISAGIYLFKVNNRKTRTMCEICSKLTTKIPERRQWRRRTLFCVSIVDFVQVNTEWDRSNRGF